MASKSDGVQKSHSDAAQMLKAHLTEKMRRKSPMPPPTEEEVKMEAMRILEKFLKKQLEKQQSCAACIDTGYQRVYEEECIETDGPTPSDTQSQRSSGSKRRQGEQSPTKSSTPMLSNQGSIHSLLDESVDFPYADDSEEALEDDDGVSKSAHDIRSRSLPAEVLSSAKQQAPAVLSKSASPSSHIRIMPKTSLDSVKDCTVCQNIQIGGGKVDHLGAGDFKSMSHPDVPSTEKSKSSSPFKSSSESREMVDMKTSGRRRFRSGSISSSDTTDTEQVMSPERKKKSVFTRLKERLDRSRTRERHDGSVRDRFMNSPASDKKMKKHKPRSREKKSKGKGDVVDSPESKASNVLEEQHKHIHGHIEQHHYQNGDHSGLLREEELWESTDINDLERSQHKHRERHQKVKESSEVTGHESSEGGFWGLFKRVTSFRKRPKKSIRESRSAEINNRKKKPDQDYSRSISVGPRVTETEYRNMPNGRLVHHTAITTSPGHDVVEGIGSSRVLDSHGDHAPIQVSEGTDLDKVMRERSFVLDFDSEEVIRKKLMESGQVDTVVDRQVHRRFVDTGIHGDGQAGAQALPSPLRSDEEKEKLYAEIADRLAEIGDSYVSPMSESASSSLGHSGGSHHRHHHHHHHSQQRHPQQTTANNPSSDSVDGEGLTALEREIRDCLRQIGDNMSNSGQIDISPETATTAAVDIVKHATYNTFSSVVKQTVGDGQSWDQLAMVFYLTKQAVTLAGQGGAIAVHVKDMAAQYIADRFAGWIVDQGGWDTVLESSSTDSELD